MNAFFLLDAQLASPSLFIQQARMQIEITYGTECFCRQQHPMSAPLQKQTSNQHSNPLQTALSHDRQGQH
jgi:hypothetical protein